MEKSLSSSIDSAVGAGGVSGGIALGKSGEAKGWVEGKGEG